MNEDLRALPVGQRLGEYQIEGVLGQGAFGITYLAKDLMLHRQYAIKEYYPREYAIRDSTLTVKAAGSKDDRDTYAWGLERFLDEARILARFDDPNIIGVRRYFPANGTAYLVMDYCEGESLDQIVKKHGAVPNERLVQIIQPLLNGLSRVHAANFLHRDIKPANIFVRHDGTPVLLDFGAARHEVVSHSKSVTSLATPGYGAVEQYSTHGKQGPWTDIYGLGATLYRMVTGDKPQDAPGRMLNDELVPASIKAKGRYPDSLLRAIDDAMQVYPDKRPQSIGEWRSRFNFTDFSENKPRKIEPVFNSSHIVNASNPSSEKVKEKIPQALTYEEIPAVQNLEVKEESSSIGSTKKLLVAVSIVIGIGLLYLIASNSSVQDTRATAVKPTTVSAFSTPAVAVIQQRAPGERFILFKRQLQVPRLNVTVGLNEQEMRWCIYEGIRIGYIPTEGNKKVPSAGEIQKFELECRKRAPDEKGSATISRELTPSELSDLKSMKAL